MCIIFGLLLSNAFNDDDDTFDYIGGFDTVHIISNNLSTDTTLPRNNGAQIRLEPLYAYVSWISFIIVLVYKLIVIIFNNFRIKWKGINFKCKDYSEKN